MDQYVSDLEDTVSDTIENDIRDIDMDDIDILEGGPEDTDGNLGMGLAPDDYSDDGYVPPENEGYSDNSNYGLQLIIPGSEGTGTIAGDGIYEGTLSDTAP